MDVKTVCLGMLSSGPASGYDLKKQFESSFGHFFAAGYGSIYPALSGLAEQGYVTCMCIPQDGRPDRKVYEITDDGMSFLCNALENPTPCHKIRSEFLATLCFAHLMANAQIEAVLSHRLEEVDESLRMIDDLESKCGETWSPAMTFVAGFGKAMLTTSKDYIIENRHLLTKAATATSAIGLRAHK